MPPPPTSADQRRVAQVGIELIGGKADEARHHLRQHAHGHERQERRAGRAHGLDLLHRHFLDRLGEELAEEAERRDGQREHAGERAEADRLDEQDRDDHRVERAQHRDQAACRPGERSGHQVARGGKPERQRKQHAERRSRSSRSAGFRSCRHRAAAICRRAILGGNMRDRNREPLPSPAAKRSQLISMMRASRRPT